MIEPGTTWKNPRTGATVTVIEHTPERASIERLMKPHTGRTDAHFHNDIDLQWWEITSGTATCTIDGQDRRMEAGERAEVPRGTTHVDPWNDSGEDLAFRFGVEPSPPFIEVFLRTLGHGMETDSLNKQDEFSLLQLFGVLRAGRADSWKVGVPVALQKPVVALGALLGRLAGKRPVTGG
jgi:mannose-6-phosphate isomerase-like protein (cupin superfamily)